MGDSTSYRITFFNWFVNKFVHRYNNTCMKKSSSKNRKVATILIASIKYLKAMFSCLKKLFSGSICCGGSRSLVYNHEHYEDWLKVLHGAEMITIVAIFDIAMYFIQTIRNLKPRLIGFRLPFILQAVMSTTKEGRLQNLKDFLLHRI